MSLFIIEKINETEVEQLQSLSRQTFYETYCLMNTKENMDKYLNENLSISTLEKELKKHEKTSLQEAHPMPNMRK